MDGFFSFYAKKSGEIRLCVDYRAVNKRTSRDAYPLLLPDEVHDWLAGSAIFSTLDLRCGYWQLPVSPGDQEKTAFCSEPGMGFVACHLGYQGHQRHFKGYG